MQDNRLGTLLSQLEHQALSVSVQSKRRVYLVESVQRTLTVFGRLTALSPLVAENDDALARADLSDKGPSKAEIVGDEEAVGIRRRVDTERKNRTVREANRTESAIERQNLFAPVVDLQHVDVPTGAVLRKDRVISREDLVNAQLFVVFNRNLRQGLRRQHEHQARESHELRCKRR